MKQIKYKANDYYTNQLFKMLRESLDLTQEEVAKTIGKNKSTIEKYEYGTSSYQFESLLKLANKYNLEIIIQSKKK